MTVYSSVCFIKCQLEELTHHLGLGLRLTTTPAHAADNARWTLGGSSPCVSEKLDHRQAVANATKVAPKLTNNGIDGISLVPELSHIWRRK
jgi:hypothetical protein